MREDTDKITMRTRIDFNKSEERLIRKAAGKADRALKNYCKLASIEMAKRDLGK